MDFTSLQTSAFPLSIGTSLAMETLFPGREPTYDPEREAPPMVDVKDYNEVWFNLRTLIRNFVNALQDDKEVAAATGKAIALAMFSEMATIRDIFTNEGGGVSSPVFYFSEYKDLNGEKAAGFALRESKSPGKIKLNVVEDNALKEIKNHDKRVLEFSDEPKPSKYLDGLILTHIPYDLLAHERFNKLDLLESFTGVVKTRGRWGSKYNPIPGENLVILPMTRRLLKVYGDRDMIKPYPLGLRKAILEIAKVDKWNGLTSESRVMTSLNGKLADKFAYSVITSL